MFVATMKAKCMDIKHPDGTEILVRSGVLMCEDSYSDWIKENYSQMIVDSGEQKSMLLDSPEVKKDTQLDKSSKKEDK